MQTPDYQNLLIIAESVAKNAAKQLLQNVESLKEVVYDLPRDVKVKADQFLDEIIRRQLKEKTDLTKSLKRKSLRKSLRKSVKKSRKSVRKQHGGRKLNAYFKKMLAAKKAKAPSFEYKGKTYYKKLTKTGMTIYSSN